MELFGVTLSASGCATQLRHKFRDKIHGSMQPTRAPNLRIERRSHVSIVSEGMVSITGFCNFHLGSGTISSKVKKGGNSSVYYLLSPPSIYLVPIFVPRKIRNCTTYILRDSIRAWSRHIQDEVPLSSWRHWQCRCRSVRR